MTSNGAGRTSPGGFSRFTCSVHCSRQGLWVMTSLERRMKFDHPLYQSRTGRNDSPAGRPWTKENIRDSPSTFALARSRRVLACISEPCAKCWQCVHSRRQSVDSKAAPSTTLRPEPEYLPLPNLPPYADTIENHASCDMVNVYAISISKVGKGKSTLLRLAPRFDDTPATRTQ